MHPWRAGVLAANLRRCSSFLLAYRFFQGGSTRTTVYALERASVLEKPPGVADATVLPITDEAFKGKNDVF